MMLQDDYWVITDRASHCIGLRNGLLAWMGELRLEGVGQGHVIHSHFAGQIGSWR